MFVAEIRNRPFPQSFDHLAPRVSWRLHDTSKQRGRVVSQASIARPDSMFSNKSDVVTTHKPTANDLETGTEICQNEDDEPDYIRRFD